VELITTDTKFDDKELAGMESAGHERYYSNPSFTKMINDMPIVDPIGYNHLKDVFRGYYGRDVQNGYDLATAYAISKNPNGGSIDKSSPIPREGAIGQKNAKEIANVQSSNTLAREQTMESTKEKNKEVKQPDVEGYVQGIENRAMQKGLTTVTFNGKTYQGYEVEQDPKIRSLSTRTQGGHKVEPDLTLYDPKTKTYTSFKYERDDNGAPKGTNIEHSYLPLQLSRDAVKRGISGKVPEANSTPPKSTKKDINGF
jgi:hypothetical protein